MIAPSSLRPDRSVSVEFGRWPCHPSVTLQRGFQRYAKGQHGTGWDRDPSDIEAIEGNGPSCFMFSIAPIGFESRPGHVSSGNRNDLFRQNRHVASVSPCATPRPVGFTRTGPTPFLRGGQRRGSRERLKVRPSTSRQAAADGVTVGVSTMPVNW